MNKLRQLPAKFLVTLAIYTIFALIIKGGDFSTVPWYVLVPLALISSLFKIYVTPQIMEKIKAKKE